MIWIRSLAFNIAFHLWTALMCFALLWMLLLPRPQMVAVVVWYLRTVGWLERTLVGIRYEVRGRENLPDGPFLLAAKHQSAWETMKLHLLVKDPAIILKRELMWIPIWGWYAAKAKMIPVDRGAGGAAIKSLIVVWLFMKLRLAPASVRIAGAAALFMLAVLFTLSGVDYLTRLHEAVAVERPQQIDVAHDAGERAASVGGARAARSA